MFFIFLVLMLVGSISFKIWRVRQFSKLTHISFWKAFLVIGK